MASTTRIAVLKNALTDALLALTGTSEPLEGVGIWSAEMGNLRGHESIELIGEDMIEQEWSTIGRLARNESITLTGAIYVRRPGANEAAVRDARDRCVALVQVIEDLLTGTGGDPRLGGVVKAARCRPAELAEFADSDWRICMLRFEIRTELQRLVMA